MLASLIFVCATAILCSSGIVYEDGGEKILCSASFFKVVAIDFWLDIWYLITTERSVGMDCVLNFV